MTPIYLRIRQSIAFITKYQRTLARRLGQCRHRLARCLGRPVYRPYPCSGAHHQPAVVNCLIEAIVDFGGVQNLRGAGRTRRRHRTRKFLWRHQTQSTEAHIPHRSRHSTDIAGVTWTNQHNSWAVNYIVHLKFILKVRPVPLPKHQNCLFRLLVCRRSMRQYQAHTGHSCHPHDNPVFNDIEDNFNPWLCTHY